MRCLTIPETQEWLAARGVAPEPYHRRPVPSAPYYTQFYTPKFSVMRGFVDWLTLNYWDKGEALIHAWDWSSYQPPEMVLVDALRFTHGIQRPLVEAPAHVFGAEEKDQFIALCILTIAFEWQSYIYFPHGKVTLFNYNGEILDFWAGQESRFRDLKAILSDYRIEYTGDMKDRMMPLDPPAPKPVAGRCADDLPASG